MLISDEQRNCKHPKKHGVTVSDDNHVDTHASDSIEILSVNQIFVCVQSQVMDDEISEEAANWDVKKKPKR